MKDPSLQIKKLRPVIINQSSSHKKNLNTHSEDDCCGGRSFLNLHKYCTHSKLKDSQKSNLSDPDVLSNYNSKRPYVSPDRFVVSKKMSEHNPVNSYLKNQKCLSILNNSTYEHTVAILSSISSQLETACLSLGNTGEGSNLNNKYIPKKRIHKEWTRDDI